MHAGGNTSTVIPVALSFALCFLYDCGEWWRVRIKLICTSGAPTGVWSPHSLYLGRFSLNGPVISQNRLSLSTQEALDEIEFLAGPATSTPPAQYSTSTVLDHKQGLAT